MNLYNRDYLNGLLPDEQAEYEAVLEKEKEGMRGFGRKNLYSQYSLAARNCLSLFPNNHLDIFDLKANPQASQLNEGFHNLLFAETVGEREILNYINQTPAFHIIGSILRGCHLGFGHHSAYLFPEFPLGTSYQADYLIIGKNSGGYEFVFVELESPKGNITIQDGELGNSFRKGIIQVNDWRRWLQENYAMLSEYFERHKSKDEALTKEFYKYDDTRIHYVVVSGIRSDFTEKTYRIAREHKDNTKIHLLHYENLVDFSCQILDLPTY